MALLAVSSYEGGLVGWRVASAPVALALDFAFRAAPSPIRAVAASARVLAAASDESIAIFSLKRRRQLGVLEHHTDTVSALAFVAADAGSGGGGGGGGALLSGDESGTMCFWDCATWEPALSVRAHKGRVHSLAVHASGKVALSAGADGAVRLWDLTKGRPVHTVKVAAEPFAALWAPNGRDFAVLFRSSLAAFSGATGQQDGAAWDLTGDPPVGPAGDKACCAVLVELEDAVGGRAGTVAVAPAEDGAWAALAGTESGMLVVCRRGGTGGCAFLDLGLGSRIKRLERLGAQAVAAVCGDGVVIVLALRELLARPPRLARLALAADAKGERVTSSMII